MERRYFKSTCPVCESQTLVLPALGVTYEPASVDEVCSTCRSHLSSPAAYSRPCFPPTGLRFPVPSRSPSPPPRTPGPSSPYFYYETAQKDLPPLPSPTSPILHGAFSDPSLRSATPPSSGPVIIHGHDHDFVRSTSSALQLYVEPPLPAVPPPNPTTPGTLYPSGKKYPNPRYQSISSEKHPEHRKHDVFNRSYTTTGSNFGRRPRTLEIYSPSLEVNAKVYNQGRVFNPGCSPAAGVGMLGEVTTGKQPFEEYWPY